LIAAPSRADNSIFGRTLLERLIISCQRAGIQRFYIATPPERRDEVYASLGSVKPGSSVVLVDRFEDLLGRPGSVDPSAGCIAFSGNVVFHRSQLEQIFADHAANPKRVLRMVSTDDDRSGEIAAGPLEELLARDALGSAPPARPEGDLPFALNGRPEDREEAELRLARSVRRESATKDAAMARLFDRKISWRISYLLARTKITPNQVTLANTALGMLLAWMFSIPSYGWRLAASLLFVLSITIDGVDGELARLQMSETSWGAKLDIITDNIVHVAVLIGIFVGCYRASLNPAYYYLTPLVLGGFALNALATYLAFQIRGADAEKWLTAVERWTGRDFAYLLAGFALINRLEWFAWGTAFGTYVFGLGLIWLTARRRRSPRDDGRIEPRGTAPEGA